MPVRREIQAIVDRLCDDYKSHQYQISRQGGAQDRPEGCDAPDDVESAMMDIFRFYMARPFMPFTSITPPTPGQSFQAHIALARLDESAHARIEGKYEVQGRRDGRRTRRRVGDVLAGRATGAGSRFIGCSLNPLRGSLAEGVRLPVLVGVRDSAGVRHRRAARVLDDDDHAALSACLGERHLRIRQLLHRYFFVSPRLMLKPERGFINGLRAWVLERSAGRTPIVPAAASSARPP